MRVTVANLKGGVGKTTSSVFLALGLARTARTLLVDADPKQSSALDWSNNAGDGWPDQCAVVALSGSGLAKHVSAIAGDFTHVVIDCGAKSDLETRGALMVTDHLVIPASPRALDIVEIPATMNIAREIDAVSPVYATVLLTQVRASTRSAVDVREILRERDVPTFRARIGLREQYASAYGTVPESLGEYGYVLDEMREGDSGDD